MLFIKLNNGIPELYPINRDNFLYLFPNADITLDPTEEQISKYGYGIYKPIPYPQVSSSEYVEDELPVYNSAEKIWYARLVVKKYDEDKRYTLYCDFIKSMRKHAYLEEADPLFMKYQRESIDKSEWLNKVAEIKQRYQKLSKEQWLSGQNEL